MTVLWVFFFFFFFFPEPTSLASTLPLRRQKVDFNQLHNSSNIFFRETRDALSLELQRVHEPRELLLRRGRIRSRCRGKSSRSSSHRSSPRQSSTNGVAANDVELAPSSLQCPLPLRFRGTVVVYLGSGFCEADSPAGFRKRGATLEFAAVGAAVAG